MEDGKVLLPLSLTLGNGANRQRRAVISLQSQKDNLPVKQNASRHQNTNQGKASLVLLDVTGITLLMSGVQWFYCHKSGAAMCSHAVGIQHRLDFA